MPQQIMANTNAPMERVKLEELPPDVRVKFWDALHWELGRETKEVEVTVNDVTPPQIESGVVGFLSKWIR